MSAREEDHARILLSEELGVEFRLYDDNSKPGMPDLLSLNGKHVAEVITTVPARAREAEKNLPAMTEAKLPHCVRVLLPYKNLARVSRRARQKIRADVLRWTVDAECVNHWFSTDEQGLSHCVNPLPILGLGAYDDGVQVACFQCHHDSPNEPHQIMWTIMHSPSPADPWSLLQLSLGIIEKEQEGGVQALAKKLAGYPTKHLVMYPFGPPGNLTAAISDYVLPPDLFTLAPPRLHPPLTDVHVWLLYRYENDDIAEGIHMCDNYWARFGMRPSPQDRSSLLWRLHYPNA
ncbi:hypothetical protein [Arthrobacter sp. B0490]|uniref:hypothetical protein n=1 Tax=Arthrobacter sp. B0490 TaxID=2058891 RepID=UPI0011B0BDA7|nr:hypothetical protein [Arthrobacter sp. B0490]